MTLNFSKINYNSFVGKLLRWPLMLIPRTARLPILQGKLRGYRWIVGSSNHGCWLGSYELEQQVVFEMFVKEGCVVFDIGANVGFYTLLGSVMVGTIGKVVAFEPIPNNLEYLKEHLRINSVSNVEIIEAAVSDQSGVVKLTGGHSNSQWHLSDQGEIEVQALQLDELVSEGKIPAPDIIKMDIEGAEFLALSGAREIISEYHPVIILSTHGRTVHDQCCKFLQSMGYHLKSIGCNYLEDSNELVAVKESAS